MDTTTGKILTRAEMHRELRKVMKQTGKEADLAQTIKADNGQKADVDKFMAAFMPDHVPLRKLPNKNCKGCHGVGYAGRNLATGKFVPCRCTL